jgi:hypothetical protein
MSRTAKEPTPPAHLFDGLARQIDLATLFDLKRPNVHRLINARGIKPVRDDLYSIKTFAKAWAELGRDEAGEPKSREVLLLKQLELKVKSQQLELDKEEGLLVERADVETTLRQVFAGMSGDLDSIANALPPRLEMREAAKIGAILKEHVAKIKRKFARCPYMDEGHDKASD